MRFRTERRCGPARPSDVGRQAVWERMHALRVSQNEVARRAGVSSGHLIQIMTGTRNPVARNAESVQNPAEAPSTSRLLY